MPNIGTVLREEIKRLSRRATRSIYMPLKKELTALKHAVAALKRENQKLLKENARLIVDLNTRMSALPPVSEEEIQGTRIGPKLILSRRKKLGLSREDFAKLIGVSAGAVMSWEMGKSKPREKVKAAFAAIRKLGKREARQRLEILSLVDPRKKSGRPGAKQA